MIRRELIKFAGGAATGLAFTPLPWRLLGDSAIWTQNWSWMPPTPRGEVAEKEAHCTLCPAGCAVKIRTCGDIPTGVWPNGEPMCPAGLAGHTLAWHPLRLRQCLHKGAPGTQEQALAAAREAAGNGVAVLDMLPGRTASLLHRMHLAHIPGARYIPAPMPEGGTAAAASGLLARPIQLAVELANVRTVLSIGTPLFDGWAAPSRSGPDRKYILWQADSWRSRTADIADTRLMIRPGSETALLLGLGHCLLEDPLIADKARFLAGYEHYRQAVARWTLGQTAAQSGVSEESLRALADALKNRGPAAVIADGDPVGGPLPLAARSAAASLNVLLGAPALAARTEPPVPGSWKTIDPTPLENVPDASVGLLLIDEPAPGLALPWAAIAPKLKPEGAVVIALTWNRASFSQRAQWLVPAPVYLEHLADAPLPHDTGTARLAVSPAILKPPEGAVPAPDFVAAVAGQESSSAALIEERAKLAGETKPAASNPVQFVSLLPKNADASLFTASQPQSPESAAIQAHGWRLASVSPMLGKLWQEWDLRPAPGEITAHPDSLLALGWKPGALVQIESAAGRLPVRCKPDGEAPASVVALSAGPAYTQLCEPSPDGAWRLKNPKVVRS